MTKIFSLSLATAASLFLGGCGSMLMPYADDFSCRKSIEGGMCGSITQIYEKSLNASGSLSPQKNIEPVNIDEEQTQLLGVLWRMTKSNEERIKEAEKKLAESDFKGQMSAGMVASMSADVRRLKEDVANKTVPKVEMQPIVQPAADTDKKRKNTRKPRTKVVQDICEAHTSCVAERNIYVTKSLSKCSDNVRVIKTGEIVEVKEKQNGRFRVSDGWITARYLKRGDTNASKN